MPRIAAGLAPLALVTALLPAARADDEPTPEPGPEQVEQCATVSASARSTGVGFNHVVTLVNDCTRAVSCEVWTDVDPSPRHTLQVSAGQSASVVTRIGSPATAVSAERTCRFQ